MQTETILYYLYSNESPTGDPFEISDCFCNIALIKKQLYENKKLGLKNEIQADFYK